MDLEEHMGMQKRYLENFYTDVMHNGFNPYEKRLIGEIKKGTEGTEWILTDFKIN